MSEPVLNILSMGVGTQSSCLYFMSCLGTINVRFDYAVFADPGREHKKTYDYLKFLLKWQKENNGIPIIVTGKKSIYKDLVNGTNSTGNRFASLPFFTKNEDGTVGMLKRQCTGEYKIQPVNKIIRKLQNKPTGSFYECNIYFGITVDEIERMSFNEITLFRNCYPFIGYETFRKNAVKKDFGIERFTKLDCINWLMKNNFPVPPSSACTFCPFQSDAMWYDLKINSPKEWKAVVKLDKMVRNSTKKGVHAPIYLHQSCVPLDKVKLKHENSIQLFNCTTGPCHT